MVETFVWAGVVLFVVVIAGTLVKMALERKEDLAGISHATAMTELASTVRHLAEVVTLENKRLLIMVAAKDDNPAVRQTAVAAAREADPISQLRDRLTKMKQAEEAENQKGPGQHIDGSSL